MSDFFIGFTGRTADDDPAVAVGEIRLADHREFFPATTEYWSAEEYGRNWLRALRHLLAGAEASCLVTEMIDPEIAARAHTRPLYRDGEQVHVQELMLFLDELDRPFDPERPWESVPPRDTVDEDGNRISEWTVPLAAIRAYVDAADAD